MAVVQPMNALVIERGMETSLNPLFDQYLGEESEENETNTSAVEEKTVVQPLEDAAVQYLKKVSTCSDLLSKDEEIELAQRIEQGDVYAKRKLAQANLRLVISIAKRYAGRGANFMDLVQEGNIGLMKAVDKFNYRLGYKFSTYATWWIKQAVFQAFSEHDRPIRLPGHVIDSVSKLRRSRDILKEKLERLPTDEELAKDLKLSVKKVQQLARVSQKIMSLEEEIPLKDGNTQMLGETIEDERFNPENDFFKNRSTQMLQLALLHYLDDKERDVLEKRFGLREIDQEKKMTLEEIGKIYGVTRECIRQTEIRALQKLRHSPFLHHLID